VAFSSAQQQIFKQSGPVNAVNNFMTLGTVVDTNDPQQMGRIRIVCSQWGDSFDTDINDIPWSMYCTPFGGQVSIGTRGPGLQTTDGGVSYGMWAIPKVGSTVLVACIDGDQQYRIYVGCVFDQFTPHTLPHGRYMFDDHPALEKTGARMKPYGPFSSREKLIQPLADNIKQAFGNHDDPNFEWRSRAADHTVSSIDVAHLDYTYSKVADDREVAFDNWNSTQGYQSSRIDPKAITHDGQKNKDSLTYCFTTPGFHSMSMDDRQENCRIRFRTTSGHQILLDDTNERIYISTARGNNWIELDQDGNVDIFSANKVNIHAEKDINFTSDETIRMHAKKGIHLVSKDEIRIQADKDIHVRTDTNLRAHAKDNIHILSDRATHLSQGESLYISAGAVIHATSASTMHLTSGSTFNILAGGDIINTGSNIHLNGPAATAATAATVPNEQPAKWTNRVPQHEPYARTMPKTDFSHDPEFKYTDKQVNRQERGRTIIRGMYWRR
jgi:hypothetical protein